MTISIGDTLPPATFFTMGDAGPEPVDASFFANRLVALFAVPGAFTPTCSAKHLPGFVEQAGALKAKGVDVIACTAVNDVFVLDAWGKASGVGEGITMLADGNGEFADAIGLAMDGSKFGMGQRSQRYAMLVRNGVVEQLAIDAPGEFKVSSAEHLLGLL
jgi:glutaredoxin/glutathione-dependent peroxiredoxin